MKNFVYTKQNILTVNLNFLKELYLQKEFLKRLIKNKIIIKLLIKLLIK